MGPGSKRIKEDLHFVQMVAPRFAKSLLALQIVFMDKAANLKSVLADRPVFHLLIDRLHMPFVAVRWENIKRAEIKALLIAPISEKGLAITSAERLARIIQKKEPLHLVLKGTLNGGRNVRDGFRRELADLQHHVAHKTRDGLPILFRRFSKVGHKITIEQDLLFQRAGVQIRPA